MGLYNLVRSLPRGTRPPEPAISDDRHVGGWGGFINAFEDLPSPLPGANPSWGGVTWDDLGTAMGLPAAWRAMNMIAGFIAQMPLLQMDNPYRISVEQDVHVLRRPWPILSYFDWMFSSVVSCVLRGNTYGVKADFDPNTGRPRQIIPVHPDDVVVDVVKGLPYYDIYGLDRTLSFSEVFHVRYFLAPGSFVGIGAIEAHRRSFTASRVLMEYGQNSYASGAVPPVVIKVNKPELAEGEAEYLQERWMMRHASGNRMPAIVPGIMEVTPIGMSMQDAEYLASRQFNIAEIAFMFNLSPEDLGVSASNARSLTYNNLEQKTMERLLYSLQPLMSRFESTFMDLLPFQRTARFDTRDILRSDLETRMKSYQIAKNIELYDDDEIRAMERLPGRNDVSPITGKVPQFKKPETNTEPIEPDQEDVA